MAWMDGSGGSGGGALSAVVARSTMNKVLQPTRPCNQRKTHNTVQSTFCNDSLSWKIAWKLKMDRFENRLG